MNRIKSFFQTFFKIMLFKLPIPLIGIFFLAILTYFLTANFIRKYPEKLGLVKGAQILQKEEEELIKHVATLISLPTNEKPTVATVLDKEKLGEQPFFKNSQKGDKVIIYTNSRKVILYRPSEDRIVEVGNVNISQGTPTSSPEAIATPTPTSIPTPSSEPIENQLN